MSEQRTFHVMGSKPAFGKAANDLAAACDLGVTGAYRRFAERVTITIRDDCTDAQRAQHADAVKWAYEQAGCVDVRVAEYKQEQA